MANACETDTEEVIGVAGTPISDLPPQSSACVYLRVEPDGTVIVEVED